MPQLFCTTNTKSLLGTKYSDPKPLNQTITEQTSDNLSRLQETPIIMAGFTFIRNFALLTAVLTLPCILQAAQLNPNGELTAGTPVSSSGLIVETIIVNSNGSTCSTPTATNAPLTSLTTFTAAAAFTTASHATAQSCTVPVCTYSDE